MTTERVGRIRAALEKEHVAFEPALIARPVRANAVELEERLRARVWSSEIADADVRSGDDDLAP